MHVYGYNEDGGIVWDVAGHVATNPTEALYDFIAEEARSDDEAFRMAMAIPMTAVMEDDEAEALLAMVA